MANPLAIALALYGGYKGYKAGKERGGGIKSVIGAALGAAGGFYGGQAIGRQLGMSNVAGTQGFTNAMMTPFKGGQAATTALSAQGATPAAAKAAMTQDAAYQLGGEKIKEGLLQRGISAFGNMTTGQKAMTLGTLAGAGAYASGAFKPEPYKRAMFTYNIAYPDLYRNRKFFVTDPKTGQTIEQDQLDYIP